MKYAMYVGNVAALLVLIIFFVVAGIGWVLNVIALFGAAPGQIGMVVARTVGVLVPPIGAVLGYI